MKKFLALLLAMVMTLALAACGGGGDTPAPKEEDPRKNLGTKVEGIPFVGILIVKRYFDHGAVCKADSLAAQVDQGHGEKIKEPAEPEPPAADFQQVSVGETITLDFVELVIGEPSFLPA